MTIRTKLTLWYAGIFFASALIVAGLSYREFEHEMERQRRHHGHWDDDMESDAWEEAIGVTIYCGIPAAILGLAGGWLLMRKTLSPINALTEAASQINERNLRQQLPTSGNGDELDRLTEVFNAMTTRLDNSFKRILEFTLHASHELKTPLTVMHGELETALREDPGPNRERLESELDEVQRLSKIVDGLTLLTKADAGLVSLKRDPVRFDELVRDCHADAVILARPANIKAELARCDGMIVQGDRHRLRQLLLNLTDNAIKYNEPGGSVVISLQRNGDSAELAITNSGPGIAPEIQERVFDRFFRGDPSHGQDVEGCGLGLSIAQWIVQSHGGEIKIKSAKGGPTCVTVRLPAGAV
jgi:signal transduction histidine kinase